MGNSKTQKTLLRLTILTVIFLIFNLFIFIDNKQNAEFLKVYFLDVGQGDSILIETPDGTQTLIDSGRNNTVINQISEIIPFFDRTLDIIIPTHSDADHVGGFPEILKRFQIKNYFDSGFIDNDDLNNEISLLVQNEKGIQKKIISRGDEIILDKENNITLKILWPTLGFQTDDNNERSVVTRLDYKDTSFLFTGDAGIEIEKKIIENNSNNLLDVDILKAGHHGSKTSSSPEFLEKVSPEITIISAGKDNKFGHPHKEVIDNLEKAGSKIKNTAEVGRIQITSDGDKYWIEEELFDKSSFFQSLISAILVKGS